MLPPGKTAHVVSASVTEAPRLSEADKAVVARLRGGDHPGGWWVVVGGGGIEFLW